MQDDKSDDKPELNAKVAKVIAFAKELCATLPRIINKMVVGTLDGKLWKSITHTFPDPLLTGSVDPLDHQLQGRKLTVFCPVRLFPAQMWAAFGSYMLPCPLVGHGRFVTPDSWPEKPRRYCDADEVAYVLASSWRCSCGKQLLESAIGWRLQWAGGCNWLEACIVCVVQ